MNETEKSGRRLTLTMKVVLFMSLTILVIIGVQAWFDVNHARQLTESQEKQHMLFLYDDYKGHIDTLEEASAMLSARVIRSRSYARLISGNRMPQLSSLGPMSGFVPVRLM